MTPQQIRNEVEKEKRIKLKVKPEGRPNTHIILDKENLKDYIRSLKFKKIHNFIQTGFGVLGCDYGIRNTFNIIDKANQVAVFTDPHQNVGHSLACITDRLEMFDIGEIKLDDLEVTSND
jgi:hypothetical protein